MTDEEKQKLNEEKIADSKETPQEPPDIEMVITLKAQGGVVVRCPLLNNKVFSYGLLKVAEKTMDEYYARAEKKTPSKHGIMDFLRTKH